jgi:hypothetical protein
MTIPHRGLLILLVIAAIGCGPGNAAGGPGQGSSAAPTVSPTPTPVVSVICKQRPGGGEVDRISVRSAADADNRTMEVYSLKYPGTIYVFGGPFRGEDGRNYVRVMVPGTDRFGYVLDGELCPL